MLKSSSYLLAWADGLCYLLSILLLKLYGVGYCSLCEGCWMFDYLTCRQAANTVFFKEILLWIMITMYLKFVFLLIKIFVVNYECHKTAIFTKCWSNSIRVSFCKRKIILCGSYSWDFFLNNRWLSHRWNS